MKLLFFGTILLASVTRGCNNPGRVKEQVTIDSLPSTDYPAVTIGTQTWTTSNLNVFVFRNGDSIPEAKTNLEWMQADTLQKAAWCYYNNDPMNDSLYGKMYNWYAVNDPRGLAPLGWHIPSTEEWKMLRDFLGGEMIAAGKLKSEYGWEHAGNGTNESKFSAMPAGERHRDGEFSSAGLLTAWWSSTAYSHEYSWEYYMYHFSDRLYNSHVSKSGGFSVRCVKDPPKSIR